MRFFLDHCVPHSVATVLTAKGHEALFLSDHGPEDSPDPVVATISEELGAVLVSNDKDFRTLAARISMGRRRFKRLSRIALRCREPKAAARMEEALSLIEFEYALAQTKRDKRMIVEILDTVIRTIR